jgi:hypothetical protein
MAPMVERSRIWGFGLGCVLSTCAIALVACSPRQDAGRVVRVDRSDLPLEKASDAERARFAEGDALFEATLREAGACSNAARGALSPSFRSIPRKSAGAM